MTTTTRTDIHRPSAVEFDPEAYIVLGFADFHATEGHRPVQTVARLVDEGWSFSGAPHGSGQCSHCGAHLRYAALMGHEATKTLLYVGETCLGNRFEATAAEFQEMRRQAAAKAEQSRREGKASAFLAEHPEAVYLSYARNIEVVGGVEVFYTSSDYDTEYATEEEARANVPAYLKDDFYAVGMSYKRGTTWAEQTRTGDKTSTLNDMWNKVERYGSLSDNALAYAMKIMGWLDEAEQRLQARRAETAAKVEAGAVLTAGRQVLEGEITKIAYKTNDFGGAWKITVALDNGTKVWGTLPSALETFGWDEEQTVVGRRVRFTGTVEVKDDDPTFGFYKRPSKAEYL